jgi:NRPS condensation-like uncharacterized protein
MRKALSAASPGSREVSRTAEVRDAPSAVLRPLGALEQLLWLLDQNSPRHFVLAAQIEGPTTIKGWRDALDLVQRRHPFLSVGIGTDPNPYFRQESAEIPLRVVEGDDATLGWESEIARELSLSFNARQAPLLRAVVLHEAERAVYILAAHHSIADGLSLSFVIRDTLQALVGVPLDALPVIPPLEEILDITACPANQAVPTRESDSMPPGKPAIYRKDDGSLPRVKGLRLAPELTSKLREKAREEGTTVHGALCSAVALAFRQIRGGSIKDPIRIWSPVDMRKLLGLGEDCAVLAGSTIVSADPQALAAFWDVARRATTDLAGVRTLDGVIAFTNTLYQAVLNGLDVQTAAQIMASKFAYEICLTNLGNLRYETSFGGLKLDAIWGPVVFAGFEGAQTIGVTTTDGTLCLVHASYTPVQSLLELTKQLLVSACDLAD